MQKISYLRGEAYDNCALLGLVVTQRVVGNFLPTLRYQLPVSTTTDRGLETFEDGTQSNSTNGGGSFLEHFQANSQKPCRTHAIPMLFPCLDVPR
jgi:hypothetical protein